ncbi:MAG: hypothetical protein WA988_10245 [Candidatus Nanopelagicales bacterium]
MRSHGRLALVAVVGVLSLIGCKPEDAASDEPDDGRLDCDAPTAEIVDLEWKSELRTGTEPGTTNRVWFLQSATVRLTNNTRHDITTSGARLLQDYKNADGSDKPALKYDPAINIPNRSDWTPTAGIDGHDSREFSDDNLNERMGIGDQPPPFKAIPTNWHFSNGKLEESCQTQGRLDRIRASQTVTLVPLPPDASYPQLGYSRDEKGVTVRFDHCAKPGDIAIDKDKVVAITESGRSAPAMTISQSTLGNCVIYDGLFNSPGEPVLRLEYPTDTVPFTWILGP